MNAATLLHDAIPICLGLCFRPGWKSFFNSFKEKKYTDNEIIEDFKNAWVNLDSSLIIKHLDKSFQYNSQWVFDSLDKKGYADYIGGKFKTLRNSSSTLEVKIVEDKSLGGKMLHIIQNGKHVYYRIKIEKGKVVKGDLCMF